MSLLIIYIVLVSLISINNAKKFKRATGGHNGPKNVAVCEQDKDPKKENVYHLKHETQQVADNIISENKGFFPINYKVANSKTKAKDCTASCEVNPPKGCAADCQPEEIWNSTSLSCNPPPPPPFFVNCKQQEDGCDASSPCCSSSSPECCDDFTCGCGGLTCSSTSPGGICIFGCRKLGQTCLQTFGCCDGLLCSSTDVSTDPGICQKPPCKEQGSGCTAFDSCCAGFSCQDSTCKACPLANAVCDGVTPCCDPGNSCQDGTCKACLPENAECNEGGTPCCDGTTCFLPFGDQFFCLH